MIAFIRKHPLGIGASAVAVVAGLAWLAFGFFGVHTLFVDDVVAEGGPVFDAPAAIPANETTLADARPAATETTEPTTDPTTEPTDTVQNTEPTDIVEADATDPVVTQGAPETSAAPEIVAEFAGQFQGDAHPTAGTASVLGNGTGQRFLRLENFESDNGPDLNVYLFNVNGDRSDYIDLGDLKGNIGDQNYEIPEGVDLSNYGEVSIWCVRFGVNFGSADLMPT